ncbi:UvrD-helicase domain-containing protein [Flavobacterium sp. CYK-55]|uniref:UvrD-helicase domain-containing protein n=1 Tax=Flavobacterium sp. CYK-55 TaxID=2835529 RepID=UPI001BCD8B5E|nr:UvrD-helicase domain-containing protein [Flavobacterium sp. CYK-55]MBS7786041.1 UvrD-helicase domain-containing protein [Flavobacterium sp. CYK-55]
MKRTSFKIYDASAGSGKTYNLVREYLKIILASDRNDAYRNILAITFTNKAVHEMKNRIVQSLSEFSKEQPSSKMLDLLESLATDLNIEPQRIKQKARQIIRHIIHNYAAFDILTIDKFTHKVIRAFAHDLGLPSTFEVSLDTDELIAEAVDSIIAKAGEENNLTRLLVGFAVEKTDEDKSWDITREIFEIGKLIYSENNRSEIEQLGSIKMEDFTAIKSKLQKSCQEIEQKTVELAGQILGLLQNHEIDLKSFSRGTFPNHIQSIVDRKYNPKNKKYHSIDEVSINKDTPYRERINQILPEIFLLLQTIYAQFEQRDFYQAFLKNISPLSLLHTLSDELKKIQQEQNLLSIAEFNALIHKEIQNQPAPFIYERLGERYRHFFIDEFQDTSEMQWKNLIPLIDNALSSQSDAGEKGSLMIVGDPKQSIYRWRGGKAEQFIALSKMENPFSNPDKKLVWLDTNYRSYSEVIAFNNCFFNFLSSEFQDLDYKDLYENKSAQKIHRKKGGYVNLNFLDEDVTIHDNDVQEGDKDLAYCKQIRKAIQDIEDLGFLYSDIAILTRRRSHGVVIANYLSQHQIPIISSETLLIENAEEVQFLVAVLEYLDNEQNLEALAKWLLFLAKSKVIANQVHDFVSDAMNLRKDSEIQRFLLKFDISIKFEEIRKMPLYEAVEAIINVFIPTVQNHAYVQYFLDIVVERAYHKQAGISDFLDHWRQNASKYSIPSPEGNNAVRIMTIHKSKGLEFPVVILPFAEENYSIAQRDKLWIEADESKVGLSRVLIDNTQAVSGFGNSAQQVYHQRKQEELLDNINVLYVALTRAEEQLYVISRHMKPNKEGAYPNNLASYFIRFLEQQQLYQPTKSKYDFGVPIRQSNPNNNPGVLHKIEIAQKRLKPSSVKIARKESVLWGTRLKEAIAFGNVVHEVLSFVNGKTDVELALQNALSNGTLKQNQLSMVSETVQRIVHHPELADYFNLKNKAFNEQVLLAPDKEVVKPDRIVVNENGEYLILDYKTGKKELKHIRQIENYQEVIESMQVRVVKKALVYTGEHIEIIHL